MFRIVRWVFRPFVLIAVSVVLVAAAVLVVFQPEAGPLQPQRPPLRPGDVELAWIYPATSTTQWERFVTAVHRAGARLQKTFPGVKAYDVAASATAGSTGVPQVALEWPAGGRLVFRWYKLTSSWSAESWVRELLARKPYPLALIGGNNSNAARALAIQLERATAGLEESQRPLLLLTTATAVHVPPDQGAPAGRRPLPGEEGKGIELTELYPGRTYRFCFTNRQMATAVTRFVWNQPDLRPDADPAYLVQWKDDSYSRDLLDGYTQVLERRALDVLIQQWGFASGCISLGLPPAALAGWYTSGYRHDGNLTYGIESSVGGFDSPNPYEARDIDYVAKDVQGREPVRRLLVVTGQAQPSRRFLFGLARSAPDLVRRLVVATGDAISFNTIYRDRMVTWPIQDLPFPLVLFCHRNPIDGDAEFRPPGPGKPPSVVRASAASGTEDLLLYGDVVEALALAWAGRNGPPLNAAGLAAGLDALHLEGDHLGMEVRGRPLFSARHKGLRNSSTGEHVVILRPQFKGERVEPKATIEVWARWPGDDPERGIWRRVGSPMTVSYDEYQLHQERLHGD
jgi:hypothetical protein